MTASSDVVFLAGLDTFGSVVDAMPASAWAEQSPCERWTALDVLGHVVTTIGFGVAILAGQTFEWPSFDRPSDLITGDPSTHWAAIAASGRTAVDGVDLSATRETPMGIRTVAEGLAFPAVDLFVHAWDIGRAGAIAVEIPADVVAFAHAYIDPIPEEKVRGENGAFGPEAVAPGDASPTEVFIAWTGRAPR